MPPNSIRTLNKVIIALIFILAGVLFFHNITSINVDIGRHIKLGEIIWQLKEVPKTNLFSFTAPDYSFVNHHWLSEVIFYKIYSLGNDWITGLRALIIFKAFVLLATYFLLFLIVKRRNISAVALAFLVSIFVFSARTEPRPEIFSYLLFSLFLLIIYRTRENRNFQFSLRQAQSPEQSRGTIFNFQIRSLWLLPILQLFWVNLHIYFVIGPIIYLFFLIDEAVNKKVWKFKNWSLIVPRPRLGGAGMAVPRSLDRDDGPKDLATKGLAKNCKLKFRVFILIILANLANPNFIKGALYPFTVLNSYGYSVAENSSLFFLAKYFGQWAPQDKLFLASLFILVGSFIVWFWLRGRTSGYSRSDLVKARVFDLLLITMTIALSFKMQRNIPLFALSVWPVMANNLAGITNYELRITNFVKKWLCVCVIILLTTSIYFVVSGKFYNWLDSSKIFGLGVSSAAQDGTDFIKENNIQGPVFNNFDIGSYLIWQLKGSGPFLQEKKGPDPFRVFVDGRPEAYPVEFFEKVYKPMQRDERVWREMSEKYGINYIFFAHTDMTEWAREFLDRINKNEKWPMVFLNDAIVIFLKDTPGNRPSINKYKITDDNLGERVTRVLDKLDVNDNNAFVNFGNALYRFHYLADSVKVYEDLIKNQPDNPYGYQGAGYAYASMNDPATQEKATKNLEKAIDLGFKTFNNYFTLGIIKANLGNYFAAEENIVKALKIKPDNQNARQALKVIKQKQGINF